MMPDNTQNPPNPEKPKIEGDRDIPSVAQNKDYSKIGVIIISILAVFAIVLIALDGMDKNQPKSMVEPKNISFKTSYGGSSTPYIVEDDPEPSPLELKKSTEPTARPINPMELQMAQEALRLAREKKKEQEKRIASPQIIFDQKGTGASPTLPKGDSSRSLIGGDPNIAFADQYSNAEVDVVQASQMQNLNSLIVQGTMISGILETAIQSDLPGMVRAIVSNNTYSFDGSQLLIPKGSRLVGRYNSGLVRGQSRIFVIWSRLIRPDGVSVNIGSYGTDNLGKSGLGGFIDTHFFERFGSSVLLSIIDAGIQVGVNASANNDNTSTVALESGNDFSRAAEIALENSIGIQPTVNVHQGSQIKVFVGKDLDFSQVAGNMPKR